jgi:hypothetical protein
MEVSVHFISFVFGSKNRSWSKGGFHMSAGGNLPEHKIGDSTWDTITTLVSHSESIIEIMIPNANYEC